MWKMNTNFISQSQKLRRRARGLQTEEIGCKCQAFLYLLSSRRKQTSDISPPSPRYCFLLYTNLKGGSLKILSCHDDTWFHLKLAILKPWVNQCIFLMEMFVFQFSSVTHTCLTLWDPMNCSMSGLPVHHQLPESTQNHVQRVIDAIQPSHPLSSPSPPALSLS